jgi:hypothetical protein
MALSVAKLMPLLVAAGLGATQKDEIEKVVEMAVDMAREVAATKELAGMRTVVTTHLAMDTFPDRATEPSVFQGFLQQNMNRGTIDRSKVGLDPWGKLYRFYRLEGDYIIDTAGPDGAFETDDDLYIAIPMN